MHQRHVVELQLVHERMMTVRKEQGAHHGYSQFRTALELLEAAAAPLPIMTSGSKEDGAVGSGSKANSGDGGNNAEKVGVADGGTTAASSSSSSSSSANNTTATALTSSVDFVALVAAVADLQKTVAAQAEQLAEIPKLRAELATLKSSLGVEW